MIIRCPVSLEEEYSFYTKILKAELQKISDNVTVNRFDIRLSLVGQSREVLGRRQLGHVYYKPNQEMLSMAKNCVMPKN